MSLFILYPSCILVYCILAAKKRLDVDGVRLPLGMYVRGLSCSLLYQYVVYIYAVLCRMSLYP